MNEMDKSIERHARLNAAIIAASGLQFDYSIGRWTNKETWRLDDPSYGLSCTDEQRAAALAAMAAFDPDAE